MEKNEKEEKKGLHPLLADTPWDAPFPLFMVGNPNDDPNDLDDLQN